MNENGCMIYKNMICKHFNLDLVKIITFLLKLF